MPPKTTRQRRWAARICNPGKKGYKRKKGDPTKKEACEILHGKSKKTKKKSK